MLEALNDYLLALRFLLEGGGPADLGLAMRVAALCAEPEQRAETKAVVDRALALERELWSGEPAHRGAEGAPTPAETAVAIEEPDPRDPQGRRLRPPGQRPARDRRRDPARRRARRGRGRGRAAWRLRGMGPADRDRGRLRAGAGRSAGAGRPGFRADDDDSEEEQDDLEEDVEVAPTASGDRPRAGRNRAGRGSSSGSTPPTTGRRPRGSATTTEAMQVPEPEGRITIESHPEPEEEHVFASSQTRHEERQPTASDGGERIHDRFNELLDARPQERRDGGRPRRLSLPASRDHRVGRARAQLRPPPPRRAAQRASEPPSFLLRSPRKSSSDGRAGRLGRQCAFSRPRSRCAPWRPRRTGSG